MRYKSEMTPEDIIRMAREAGFNPMAYMGKNLELFGLFHHLAIAAERERVTFELVNEAQRAVQEAVWAEREACAKVCDAIDVEYEGEDVLATWCATAIRSRGEK